MTDFPVHRVVNEYEHFADARVLDFLCLLLGNDLPLRCEQLARFGVENIVRQTAAGKTVGKVELFVELIPPDLDHVVTARVEEEVIELLAHGILRGHFSGTDTTVQSDQAVRFAPDRRVFLGIPFDRRLDHLVVAEQLLEGAVAAEAQRAQKHGRGQLTLSVHAHPKHALRVLLEFEPGAAVGNDRRFVHLLARLVRLCGIVHTGGTNELRHDNAFRAVDNKGTVLRHQRKIAHEHVLFQHLVLHLIDEAHLHAKGQGVRGVAVAAFFFVVLGLIPERVVEEIQLEVVGKVGNGREILEDVADALVDKGIVAFLLNLDEIGNVDDFVDLAELSSLGFAVLLNW